MRVRFTASSRVAFLEALDYIRRDSALAADGLLSRSREALQRLGEFPESGRMIPEFEGLQYREVLVGPYRFFYRVADDVIWIVALWHDRQLPESPDA